MMEPLTQLIHNSLYAASTRLIAQRVGGRHGESFLNLSRSYCKPAAGSLVQGAWATGALLVLVVCGQSGFHSGFQFQCLLSG